MSWNIGDNRNLFLKLKSEALELRSKPKDSAEKVTLTLEETQQLTNNEKIDSKIEICCLK